jgi:STE24 endopeptidase
VLLATLLIAALVGSPDSAASVGHDSTRTSVATPARDYLAEMRASFTPENRSYWKARVTLAFVDPVVGLLIGALVLFTGLAARMRDLAAKLTRSRWLQLLVVLALFTLVTLVLSFPLTWYGDFVLEHH